MNNFFQLVQSPKPINDFPRFERFEIASQLQDFHSLFRFFWDYSNCCFSKHLPTAWVNFDIKNGDFINFNFNPDYYKSLDLFNKSFICSHEMLHIMLEHGIRTREYPKEDMELLNKATDIVVNEMLVNDFNFDKELVKDWKKFCWIETLFEKPELVEKNKSFRYYYDLLKSGKNLKKQDGSGQGEGQLVDVHNFNDLTEDQQKQVMDVLSKLAKNLTKDEMEKFFKNKEETDEAKKINDKLDNMQAGCGAGFWSQLNIGNVKKKKKWETVIKEWEKKVVANLDHEVDRWDRKARRFSDILTGKNYYLGE